MALIGSLPTHGLIVFARSVIVKGKVRTSGDRRFSIRLVIVTALLICGLVFTARLALSQEGASLRASMHGLLSGVVAPQENGEKAWAMLEAGIGDKNARKRALAIRVLGLLPNDSRAIELAEKALEDKEPAVRVAAATALGQNGSKASSPKLRELLKDSDIGTVIAAAAALKALGDPAAYYVYYAVLTGERKSGSPLLDEQRKMLKDPKKMAQFGFESGVGFVPFASIGVGAVKALARDDSSPIRAAAAKELASDPDPRSGDALVKASSDKNWIVRAAVLDAIARRADPALLNAIIPSLQDENDAVRYTAAAAVIRLDSVSRKAARH